MSARVITIAALLAVLPAALQAQPSQAQQTDGAAPPVDWNIINRAVIEHYEAQGPANLTPYSDEGLQYSNELDARFSWNPDAFITVDGEASVTLNQSDYEGQERGLVARRATLRMENGQATVPFRVEAGDFFAVQSPRTFQRSLKGAMIEAQPGLGRKGWAQSIQAFAGQGAATWRDIDRDALSATGISWLVEGPDGIAFAINGVLFDDDSGAGAARHGATLGLPVAWSFAAGPVVFDVEAEYSLFSGDTTNAQDVGDDAVFFEMDGRTGRYDASYRFQYSGTDYAPAGASFGRDLISHDASLNVALPRNLSLGLRGRHRESARSTATALSDEQAGLSLTGTPLSYQDRPVAVSFDAFRRNRTTPTRSVDDSADVISASLRLPVRRTLGVRLSGRYSNTENAVGNDSILREASLSADWSGRVAGLDVTLGPGLTVRHTRAADQTLELAPRLFATLSGDGHSLVFSHDVLELDASAGAADTRSERTALDWRYTTGAHEFTASLARDLRDPDPGADGTGLRMGVSWLWRFGAEDVRRAGGVLPALVGGGEPGTVTPDLSRRFALIDLEPGLMLADASDLLAARGWGALVPEGPLLVTEAQAFGDITARQRVVLDAEIGRLRRSGIVLEPRIGGGGALERLYQEVERELIRRYGSPSRSLVTGDFGTNPQAAIRQGRLQRVLEWTLAEGVLRAGLPDVPGAAPRVEVVLAPSQPPLEQRIWGFRTLQ